MSEPRGRTDNDISSRLKLYEKVRVEGNEKRGLQTRSGIFGVQRDTYTRREKMDSNNDQGE